MRKALQKAKEWDQTWSLASKVGLPAQAPDIPWAQPGGWTSTSRGQQGPRRGNSPGEAGGQARRGHLSHRPHLGHCGPPHHAHEPPPTSRAHPKILLKKKQAQSGQGLDHSASLGRLRMKVVLGLYRQTLGLESQRSVYAWQDHREVWGLDRDQRRRLAASTFHGATGPRLASCPRATPGEADGVSAPDFLSLDSTPEFRTWL